MERNPSDSDRYNEDFATTYATLAPGVTSWMHRHIHDKMTAEDLTQATFLKIYGKLDPSRYNQHAQKGLVYRAANQVLLDHLRRPHVRRESSLEATCIDYDQLYAQDEPGYSEIEELEDARPLLEPMEPRERAAVLLSIVYSWDARDIARALHVSRGSAYRIINEGLAAARDAPPARETTT